MIAEELINPMIPPLKLSDSTEKAVKWMEEFRVNQLPVVKNRHYLGLITEDDIIEKDQNYKTLDNIKFGYDDVYVMYNQHFYRVMEVAIKNKIQVVPVLDEHQEFFGVITVNDTITPPIVAHEFNRLIKNSELHFIDKCGHAPMMEHPAEFNRILAKYLAEHP